MLTFLESHWPYISILLLLVLLTALLFVPFIAGAFSIAMLVLSTGMATVFTMNKQIQAYHKEPVDRAAMFRNIFFEVLGLLITVALAIFLVQVIVGIATPLIGGGWLGIGITIALSLLVGLGAAWLVKVTWRRLTTK